MDNNDCEKIRERMIPYLNHITSKEETGSLVLHLAECAGCRNEMTENIKLHSRIKLAFNQAPDGVKLRAYDKIPFPKKEVSVTELIADDIAAAVHVPVLSMYASLARSLINCPKKITNYALSYVNDKIPERRKE